MEADLKNLADNPQTTLLEGLHSVAYTGGLGRPLIVPDGCLGGLNAGACQGGSVRVVGRKGGIAGVRQQERQAIGGGAKATPAAGHLLGHGSDRRRYSQLLSLLSVLLLTCVYTYCRAEVLADFYAANYTAPRMVLAGAGLEHDELVRKQLARVCIAGTAR